MRCNALHEANDHSTSYNGIGNDFGLTTSAEAIVTYYDSMLTLLTVRLVTMTSSSVSWTIVRDTDKLALINNTDT